MIVGVRRSASAASMLRSSGSPISGKFYSLPRPAAAARSLAGDLLDRGLELLDAEGALEDGADRARAVDHVDPGSVF